MRLPGPGVIERESPRLYGVFMASSDRKSKRLTAAVVWLPMEHYSQTWQLVWNYNDTDPDGKLIITGTMSPTVRPVGDFKTTKKASRDAGWYVSVRWEYIKNGWVPVGLGIESNQGERIGAEHLRTIRTGEVIEASIWPLRALKALQVVGGDIDIRSLENWALPEQHLGRKRSYDDDHWRHVAEVVKREQFSGNTKWVQAVQEQVPDADGYRPTTAQAKRWVQRAREMGLL